MLGDGLSVVPELNWQRGMVGHPHPLLSRRSILLLVAGSVSVGACGTTASLRIQQRAEGIEAGFVEFPVWRRTTEEPLSLANKFSGRLTGQGRVREILIRAGRESAGDSIDSYAVRLQPPFTVRAASAKEWQAAEAEALPGKQFVTLKHEREFMLSFQGKQYKYQGQLWRAGAASPGGRWLVLHSHDDGDWTRIGRGTGPFATSTPSKGAAYFEVFDTFTGDRVFLARTRWSDELTLSAVEWFGDHYLILTVDARSPFHQKCLFVSFP